MTKEDKYLQKREKLPKGYPDMIPPFLGYFEDDVRKHLKIPDNERCADAFFYACGEKEKWNLVEHKSNSNLLTGITQLESTIKHIKECGELKLVNKVWLCFHEMDVMMKGKFSIKPDKLTKDTNIKILYRKGTNQPFMINNLFKVYIHQEK